MLFLYDEKCLEFLSNHLIKWSVLYFSYMMKNILRFCLIIYLNRVVYTVLVYVMKWILIFSINI